MQTENIFRIILPILIFAFIAHRGYYTKKSARPENDTLIKREEGLVTKLAAILSLIGFIAMIVYVLNPKWLAWASLSFPRSEERRVGKEGRAGRWTKTYNKKSRTRVEIGGGR